MYAIVRAGGRQEKVSVGDVLIIDKVSGEAGDAVELTPLMVVDGSTVTIRKHGSLYTYGEDGSLISHSHDED